jgi:hypothetical protein
VQVASGPRVNLPGRPVARFIRPSSPYPPGQPMYVPPHFAVSDPATLHDFIERHSFGLLVSRVGGEPFASHLPFLLDRAAGPHGTLLGHMARANPQWRDLAAELMEGMLPPGV